MKVLKREAPRRSTGGSERLITLASKGPRNATRSSSESSDVESTASSSSSEESSNGELESVRRISTGGRKPRMLLASKGPRQAESGGNITIIKRISTGGKAPRKLLASKGPRNFISRSPSPEIDLDLSSLQKRYRPEVQVLHFIRSYRKACNRRLGSPSSNHVSVSPKDVKLARRIRGDYNYYYL